jgi:phage baseplate assembly protein W
MPIVTNILAEQPDVNRFGANWQIQFRDANGNLLNMGSFDEIDFGAISYKEIFQNVKTILATPIFSCPLERTLGVDQTVVDQPMNQATGATIAILDAIYFWEPRAEVVSVDFEPDILTGHLAVNVQLKIKNFVYGTTDNYLLTNAFTPPPATRGGLPQMNVPVPGPPGPAGPEGPEGPAGEPIIPDPLTLNQLFIGAKSRVTALPNGCIIEVQDGTGAWIPQQQYTES